MADDTQQREADDREYEDRDDLEAVEGGAEVDDESSPEAEGFRRRVSSSCGISASPANGSISTRTRTCWRSCPTRICPTPRRPRRA